MNAKLILNNNYIDSASGRKITIISPWDQSELGTLESATAEEATAAVNSAAEAFKEFRYSNLSSNVGI